jgi:hypothetical protein
MTDLTKDTINCLLLRNDRAVYRALIVLFERQTADEQRSENTLHDNGIGFTGADAEFMSSLAKQVIERGSLSPRQLAAMRKLNKHGYCPLAKYWGQLKSAAEAKAAKCG